MKNKSGSKYPLSGIKVLELARVLAGPWAGQILSDLGADVVKVEAPNGDETRSWGPIFFDDNSSSYFRSTNRGKKSFLADFNNDEDLRYVKNLAGKADIVIENFKVNGLRKFGLDYKTLKKINSKLIYCSITGFGQTGPDAHRVGYDLIIQAMGGIMDITGEPDQGPQKPGVAYADIFTGLYSVIGIQSALISRSLSGQGCHIDMALFDTQLGVLANQAVSFFYSGVIPKRMGNAHPSIVPYQQFKTKDGSIIIACGNDNQFIQFCMALNWTYHLDVRFETNRKRLENRKLLVDILEKEIAELEKKDLLQKLELAGVPAASINNVKEAFHEKQALHRGLVSSADKEPLLRTPLLFDNLELNYKFPAPKLGDHTELIKKDLNANVFWKD